MIINVSSPFFSTARILEVFSNYNFKKDFTKTMNFALEFIVFQKITLKPLLAGFILSFLLTSTRALHTSLCNSLNSIYSLDLLLFASCTAIFFHIWSPWCKISKFISEILYEVATPILFFLIGGITASLIVMNLQENAVSWIYIIKITAIASIVFYIAFTYTTTLPYFLLMKKPAQGNNFRETAKHPSMLVTCFIFFSLSATYFIEPNIFPELNICK